MHDRFFEEAERLREKYKGRIEILVGFEGDWIREESVSLIQQRLGKHRVDMFVGSVHHVHTIPIDFNKAMYMQAREKSGGTDDRLFGDYFDWQLELLETMKPPVVGHFDLIRLYSDDANRSWKDCEGDVWEKILRNLRYIAEYGGLLELNSSALRKGMDEPYPKREICQVSHYCNMSLSPRDMLKLTTPRLFLQCVVGSFCPMTVMAWIRSRSITQKCCKPSRRLGSRKSTIWSVPGRPKSTRDFPMCRQKVCPSSP